MSCSRSTLIFRLRRWFAFTMSTSSRFASGTNTDRAVGAALLDEFPWAV